VTLMRWVEEGKGDLVISDVIMPDGNGLEALPLIAQDAPRPAGDRDFGAEHHHDRHSGAEAEAFDYLPKPFDLPDLMKRSARRWNCGAGAAKPAPAPREAADDLPLVGRTPAMQALYRLVARVMNTDLPVLITGESGTGKSLIARAIHDFSDRRNMPFVVAQAADLAISRGLPRCCRGRAAACLVFDEVADYDEETRRPGSCGCWTCRATARRVSWPPARAI
jgi:two-component system, NtrC family, nitrogen regulation response regulator GlnG